MSVPRLPAFDAKSFSQRLYERVRKESGGAYSIFDPLDDSGKPLNFPRFVQGLRGLRDNVATHDVQLKDQKSDIDSLRAMADRRLDAAEGRLAALEAQQNDPFPASG